jgi:DNA polymerase-3 subunit gamma/tau
MTYQVLARKWRPRTFSELVGQKHVLKALTNALDKSRLHHAYLFTGTRGVGKTSLARIMAKAMNCEKGVSSSPCLTCQTCLDIDAGRFVDLIEIDAASRTKVEDTREILDNVQYRPTIGRYKIYLIDEVHMLSAHSFNALLKTLEEPPSYVVFILATTDPQKIPVTVLSRCLQFTLKYLLPDEIAPQLEAVCLEEKIAYQKTALLLLARAANGSMRDGLSLLDQAISCSDNLIDEPLVSELLGIVGEEKVTPILDALLSDDGASLINQAESLVRIGADLKRVLDDLVDVFHQISLMQCIPQLESKTSPFIDYVNLFDKDEVQLLYQIALKGREDLIISTSYRVGFEMTLLRMLAFKLPSNQAQKQVVDSCAVDNKKPAQIPVKESKEAHKITTPNLNIDTKQADASLKSTTEHEKEVPIERQKEPRDELVKNEIENEMSPGDSLDSNRWGTVVSSLDLGGMGQTVLTHCCFLSQLNERLTLGIEPAYQAMLTDNIRGRIESALCDHFGKPIKLVIEVAPLSSKTPAQLTEQRQSQRLVKAKEGLEQDPFLNEIVEQFDGKIDEKSIKLMDEMV